MRPRPRAVLLASILLGLAFAPPARAQFLNGLHSGDGVDVIAVGDSGLIERSVDGGVRWAKSNQGATSLRAVAGRGLVLLIVGDAGQILRSTDDGGTWSTTSAPGSPNLLDVEMPDSATAYAVGTGGTVLRSTDAGVTWTALGSGTSNTIRRARFVDALHGWIVGDNGFSARTADGGASWSPSGPSTPNHLYAVDQLGARIWIAGANSTCWKSIDDGVSWIPINLRIDSRSDVRAVTLQSADTVFIAGGGGFVRRSADDGASWTFLQHQLAGVLSDMVWVGARGFVSSVLSPAVIRSNDHGDNWLWAVTTTIKSSWVNKQPLITGQMRGSTIALNGTYRNEIYAVVGNRFYESRDDGETWSQFSILPNGYDRANAFVVNPKDSMEMVCTANIPNVLLHTSNGGGTWTNVLTHAFGEYGIPLEMNPDHPDTLLFGGDSDVLYRSTDFGKTWAPYGSTSFRSPCDLVVVPESDSNLVLVGDGITGFGNADLWRSVDGGVNFVKTFTSSGSEIPEMSNSRLQNNVTFATNWTTGGVERTQDSGLTWSPVASTTTAWGTDVCKEDPNVVLYGIYSGGATFMSFDGGNTFGSTPLPGSNETFYARDRACVLAVTAGGGIYKLVWSYAVTTNPLKSITVTAANGGEVWAAGSAHDITWNSANVVLAKVEYRRTPADSWQMVAEVPGYYGRYGWTAPFEATTSASIRVSDAWDASLSDTSDAPFTIALPLIAASPIALGFGSRPIGSSTLDSVAVSNPGSASLHVISIHPSTPAFLVSPSSLTIAPGAQSQVFVTFRPSSPIAFADSVTVLSDAGNAPALEIPLAGAGTDTLMLDLLAPDGGEVLPYGTTQKIAWQSALVSNVDLDYRISPTAVWQPIASNVPAINRTYAWTIPNAPTTTARVRARQSGGAAEDISAADFSIVVPQLATSPSTEMDFTKTTVGVPVDDSLRVSNAGTGSLTISMITSNRPTFIPHRTGLVIPAGGADTVGFTFVPAAAGYDTATITLIANDPASPHVIRAVGVAGNSSGGGGPVPTEYALMQNQPNPCRTTTLIRYALPVDSEVSLELFNLQGQRVATLVRGNQPPGNYAIEFDPARTGHGVSAPAGVYFYRLRAGEFSATRKMLLMR